MAQAFPESNHGDGNSCPALWRRIPGYLIRTALLATDDEPKPIPGVGPAGKVVKLHTGFEAPGGRWDTVDLALRFGYSGLSGGSSLLGLLKVRRGAIHRGDRS